MKSVTNDKNKFLFQAIAESVSLYGTDGLQFILLNLKDEKSVLPPEEEPSLSDLFLEINKAIQKNGIDHVIYLIQNKKNLLPAYTEKLRHTEKLNEMIFKIVCNIFDTDKKSVVEKTNRNGRRVYASGTIIKIFIELLDYSVEEVQKLIPKSKPVISKHKMIVSSLDYKHPAESDAFKKYLFCKHEIINFILNQENER